MNLKQFVRIFEVAVAIIVVPIACAGSKYSVLYNFAASRNGGPPLAAPVLDPSGNLYGPAGGGVGSSNLCNGPCGVVFKMARSANGKWRESVALNFSTYFNFAPPGSGLSFDSQGNLYGILGGFGAGPNWVYQLTPSGSGWGLNLIYEGYGSDVGGVVADDGGNVYGSVGVGSDYSSTIGKLSPGSQGWTYTNLYEFCGKGGNCRDGAEPRAPLSWDTKGNLYGTDYAGGLACPDGYGCGAAFQMTPNGDGGWTYHVMHRFGSFKQDGEYPWGGLVVDASGNAYGTTLSGGPYGNGTVFKLTENSKGEWKETLLYAFPDVSHGAAPWGNLVFDRAGNLYGVNNGGRYVCGVYYCGEVFKLAPQKNGTWKYSVVHDFAGPDGAYPYGVVIDKQGNLFGTDSGGGTYNNGVVFEIRP
jgi:uncharacterized repeat protein (TIGR03803 family)